jgi:hypothetical protein
MLGGRRGGGSHDRINALVAFLAGACSRSPSARLLAALPPAPAAPLEMIGAVQRAVREFQLGDVVDDRAMLGLQLVGVPSARDDAAANHEPKVSIR